MLMPSIFGNDFMNDFFGGFPYKSNGTMQTDVSETDKGYKVTMNLPGYQKEDIKDGCLRSHCSHATPVPVLFALDNIV